MSAPGTQYRWLAAERGPHHAFMAPVHDGPPAARGPGSASVRPLCRTVAMRHRTWLVREGRARCGRCLRVTEGGELTEVTW